MSATMFRLMWKEYRVLRSFWLALAVFGLFCDALIVALVSDPQERLPGFVGLAATLPACFALGAGATLFAMEREESTRDFLRCLPITSSRIFTSKVLLAIGGTLLIAAVLLAVAICGLSACNHGTIWTASAVKGLAGLALMYSLVVLQATGWATCFSLKTARPLLAAILGAVGALSCMAFVQVLADQSIFFRSDRSWAFPIRTSVAIGNAVAIAAIWAVNVWLGSGWLHGAGRAARFWRRSTERPSLFNRLMWQEWRRSRRMVAVLFAVGIALPVLIRPAFIPMTGLVFALLGSCTFLGDQERQQFRFFAERGVRARDVWLSRQAFWAGAAVLLALVLFALHDLGMKLVTPRAALEVSLLWNRLAWVFDLAGYAAWIALAFGAGQLSSMFLRSGLLAAVLGVILAGLLLGWAVLMHALTIGFWWSVAPLVVALFAATWLRCGGWILERRGWRAWLAPALVLIVPATTIMTAVPIYRVWEIPDAVVPLTASPSRVQVTSADEAARRFFQACEQIRLDYVAQIQLAPLFDPANDEPTSDDLRWLGQNRSKLNAAIDALMRLPAEATVAGGAPRSPVDWGQLAAMIIRYGQIAQSGGELDEAWRRYRAVLRLARFLRRDNGWAGTMLADSAEQAAAAQLARWGAREGQTVERLHAALGDLVQLDKHDERLSDIIRREYESVLVILHDVQSQPDEFGRDDPRIALVAKWAPWEFARSRRLAHYSASLDLFEAQQADAALASGQPVVVVDSPHVGAKAAARRLEQTTLMYYGMRADMLIIFRLQVLDYRRATQLALAAEAWRLENGELPEKLADLEGPYFNKLPTDPYTNQPFDWFRWGLQLAVRSQNAASVLAGTPFIYVGAPFLYSDGDPSQTANREQLEYLRRRSPEDPISRFDSSPEGGGSPPPSVDPLNRLGMNMPGAASAGTPSSGLPAGVDEPVVRLTGLTFPIPDLPDAESKPEPESDEE